MSGIVYKSLCKFHAAKVEINSSYSGSIIRNYSIKAQSFFFLQLFCNSLNFDTKQFESLHAYSNILLNSFVQLPFYMEMEVN